jgi:hypothetical protein
MLAFADTYLTSCNYSRHIHQRHSSPANAGDEIGIEFVGQLDVKPDPVFTGSFVIPIELINYTKRV